MALKRAPDLCILPVFFMVRRHLPKQSKVASLGRRLHLLGHRNVTSRSGHAIPARKKQSWDRVEGQLTDLMVQTNQELGLLPPQQNQP